MSEMASHRWRVGITTAPRPDGKEFLTGTIASLLAAGWGEDELVILAEPDSPVPPQLGVAVKQNARKLGVYANWREGLMHLLPCPDGMVALVQDDQQVRPGLKAYLERTATEDGVYSPYTSKKDYKEGPAGWFQTDSGWALCGAMFFAMNGRTASLVNRHMPLAVSENKHVDAYVGVVLKDQKIPLYLHRPTLTQHLADNCSTAGYTSNEWCRTGRGFIDDPIT